MIKLKGTLYLQRGDLRKIADHLGIRTTTLSRYRAGVREPRRKRAVELSKAFKELFGQDIPAADFVVPPDPPSKNPFYGTVI